MNSSVGHSMPINCTSRRARRDVLAIEPFEEPDLRLFAGKGADQPYAGIVLLRLRGDVGEAGLDALEAVVNLCAEILHQDAGQRHGRQRHQRQIGADAQQEEQREDA